mmetsp:Transcript_4729/g.6371  ORF Transcript_4729/g.6371 Transcript_4729/m.6371 type:complete len:148 (+) Transcript_4729:323-766(+)
MIPETPSYLYWLGTVFSCLAVVFACEFKHFFSSMWNQFVPSLFSVRRGYKLAHTTRGVFLSGAVDPGEMRRVLLVIAHPDDESMFFGPTLLALAGMQAEVSVLCLSTGNFEGKGKQRSLELKAACRLFNVPPRHACQLSQAEFPAAA